MKKRRRWIERLFVLLFVTVGGVFSVSQMDPLNVANRMETAAEGSQLEVHFLDVGQGDATLIICDGEAMLIDAGGNDKGTWVQSYLLHQNIDRLEYVIGTHPDADHYGGLDVILYKFDFGTAFLSPFVKDTATVRDVYAAIASKSNHYVNPAVGEVYPLGGASFSFVADGNCSGDNANDHSLAILLNHGANTFLFTGDAEAAAEKRMIDSGLFGEVDVYKAGHHGSKTSTTIALYDVIRPDYVVISCGNDNAYGHPAAAVLDLIRQSKALMFRTDDQGTIVVYSDGNTLSWNMPGSENWTPGEYKQGSR